MRWRASVTEQNASHSPARRSGAEIIAASIAESLPLRMSVQQIAQHALLALNVEGYRLVLVDVPEGQT